MSWIAVILLVTSAFMHAGWNFISKRRSPTLAFFFVAAASGGIAVLPLLYSFREFLPLLPPSLWGLVALTGVAQAVYLLGLAGAYQRGDISLAYPLARALPVLAVALVSLLLGRGAAIGRLGLVGMVLITIGCIVLPLPHFGQLRLRHYTNMVYLMAIVAALGTTGYTLIDDIALRQLRDQADLPLDTTSITLLFVTLQILSTAVMTGFTLLLSGSERQRLVRLAANRSLLLTGALTGLVIMATYGLVLAAMAYVRDVSYVAAFRQLSIPIGALLGLVWQGETPYRPKLAGIAVITLGLILVGVG